MNAIVTAKDFEERLFEKIRTDIGALMTDEQLKALVESAIERTFFQDQVERDNYGSVRTRKAPKLLELMNGLLATQVRECVKEWVNEHPEEVKEALDKALQGGLTAAVGRAFEQSLTGAFQTMGYNIQQALMTALQR